MEALPMVPGVVMMLNALIMYNPLVLEAASTTLVGLERSTTSASFLGSAFRKDATLLGLEVYDASRSLEKERGVTKIVIVQDP